MDLVRLVCVLTHPTQYYSPWFRHIAAHAPELDLTVIYASEPTPEQQGVGFGLPFTWDAPLREGYRNVVVRSSKPMDNFHSGDFWGLDVPEVAGAIRQIKPDVALIPGWNSVTLLRALAACKRWRIPVLYRGDTHLGNRPVGGFKGSLWKLRTSMLLRHFYSGYLAVGARSHQYLKSLGAPESAIFTAPHCVDNEMFAANALPFQNPVHRSEFRRRHGFREDAYLLLFAGKLEPIKRPGDLISAAAGAAGAGVVFAGAGPLRENLVQQAKTAGVDAAFLGFVNQSEMSRVFAAVDALVLPSQSETWGLIVNEALATGLPCIVSDRVGCAPDLIDPGETGEVFRRGDVADLVAAIHRVRSRPSSTWADDCRKKATAHSFAAATRGLVAAAQSVRRAHRPKPTKVTAVCGCMAFVGGLERQTFQALEVARKYGADVHVIGNEWAESTRPGEGHPIKRLADQLGATWSAGRYVTGLGSAFRNPREWPSLAYEFLSVNSSLVREINHRGAKVVFFPDYHTALRHFPSMLLRKGLGVRTILRVGNAPERVPFHETLWRGVLPRMIDQFVANSDFGARRMQECGVPVERIAVVKNTVVKRRPLEDAPLLSAGGRTVLYVGQIAPFKGPHLLLDAAERMLAAGRHVDIAFAGRFPDWPPEYIRYGDEIKRRASAPPLHGHVQFLGEVEDVASLMRSAYILAAPIIQEETFGNVVLEAQTVGLPAVVFPRGGLPELVQHRRTGFLCHDSTVDALIEGLEWFLDDPARRNEASLRALEIAAAPNSPYARDRYEAGWLGIFGMKCSKD